MALDIVPQRQRIRDGRMGLNAISPAGSADYECCVQ
jgi:hypothetical protein